MSTKFQMLHLPPQHPIIDQFPLTPIVSKVFELLVSVHLGHFMECNGVLPSTHFAYRKGLGTCDALLWVAHTLQRCFEEAAGC